MKVGFIGAGRMAEAMIQSLVKAGVVNARDLCASDISATRRRFVQRRYGISTSSRNKSVVAAANIVFLAVKPQDLEGALGGIAGEVGRKHLVISIAAGWKIRSIESFLPQARIVRVMPNLPCLVSEGMSAFCVGAGVTPADRKKAVTLLSCFGRVLALPEEQFDAVTAVSGSGPAFFAYVLDIVAEAGVSQGMKRKDALMLAEQTMLGTAKLLTEKKIEPRDLVKAVASSKGTTAAGLAVLEKSSVAGVLTRTIRAAAERSRELAIS